MSGSGGGSDLRERERVRVAIGGVTGRMGRAILRLAEASDDLRALGGTGRSGSGTAVADAGSLIERCDVFLDVSAPDALEALLAHQADRLAGRALVVGTTGLGPALDAKLDALAGRAAVLVASNFSVGVNLLLALVRRAAAVLPADTWDVEIIEAHHRAKADAPSGTAVSLGDAVDAGRGTRALRLDGRTGRPGPRPAGDIGFHAVRGGGVVGEHRVLFLGERERIELAHSAADRDVFADGALTAARWIAGRPAGRYTMNDVLGG